MRRQVYANAIKAGQELHVSLNRVRTHVIVEVYGKAGTCQCDFGFNGDDW